MRFAYDAVGLGMWAYSHAAFRVEVLGPRRFRLAPRTLIVVTHRRETDVPVICPPLYLRARLWKYVDERMAFAAREDMFMRGFFAGFPPELSPRVRKVLYRVGVGSLLPIVHVHPIRSARVALVKEVLEEERETPLVDALPDGLAEGFRKRASELGIAPPVSAGEALRGEYADLLWRPVSRDDVGADGLERLWARRAARAAAEFRFLVELVRSGRSLVVFPEGRPSPDGEIGPVRRGIDALVRRARPSSVLPIALAYDPLVRGRIRALVTFGERVATPSDEIDASILALLRRTMPLTCGQYVASRLVARTEPSLAGLAEAVDVARSERRAVDPALARAETRARRLAEALREAKRRPEHLPYLAREYESAHAAGPN